MGSKQVNVKNFTKVGVSRTAERAKPTLEGPAVPLTFDNETVKLGNCGQSVMPCSRHIRGNRRRTNKTPFPCYILLIFKGIVQHFMKLFSFWRRVNVNDTINRPTVLISVC